MQPNIHMSAALHLNWWQGPSSASASAHRLEGSYVYHFRRCARCRHHIRSRCTTAGASRPDAVRLCRSHAHPGSWIHDASEYVRMGLAAVCRRPGRCSHVCTALAPRVRAHNLHHVCTYTYRRLVGHVTCNLQPASACRAPLRSKIQPYLVYS